MQTVKSILGYIKCKVNHISKGRSCYLGKGVKVIHGRSIKLGNEVSIRPLTDLWCSEKGEIIIGDRTDIGRMSRISINNQLVIGEDVLISPNVYITDCDHSYQEIALPVMKQGIVKRDNRVKIKDGSFIGINSVLIGNITIGKGAVIGANSVVTHSIPDYSVAVGTPARVIKTYDQQKKLWINI